MTTAALIPIPPHVEDGKIDDFLLAIAKRHLGIKYLSLDKEYVNKDKHYHVKYDRPRRQLQVIQITDILIKGWFWGSYSDLETKTLLTLIADRKLWLEPGEKGLEESIMITKSLDLELKMMMHEALSHDSDEVKPATKCNVMHQ